MGFHKKRGYLIKRHLWLLFAFMPFCGHAQTTQVTKLLLQLKKPMPDTTRLRLLNDLGVAYQSVDPSKKFYYATISKQLALKLHNGPAIANAYISMGISYGVRSKLDSALYYFSLAYDQAQKSKYDLGIGKSLSDIGFVCDRLDKKQDAIKYYFQALPYLKRANFQHGINQCYTNIGSLYFDMKQYTLAQSYFSQVLKNYTQNKDTAGIAAASFSMGNCYESLGYDKPAMASYQKSLDIRTKLGDINGTGLALKGMGNVYLDRKQYDKALNSLDSAYKYISSLQDTYEESAILMDKTDVYIAMHNYDMAKKCALQCLANGYQIKSKLDISESLEKLIRIYKAKNDIAKAFKYQSAYIAILDSMQVEKAVKDVTLTEFGRIRTENASLAKDNQTISTKNTDYLARLNDYNVVIIAISLILVLVVIILFFLYRRNREKQATNKILRQQKEEIADINEELETLNEELSLQMEITNTQNIELERLNNVKNKFFSIISHDLRAPIGNLQTIFNFYHHGDIGKAEMESMLVNLEDTILSTGTFLDNLLEWSKSQLDGIVIKPVNFKINEVIQENIHLFETQIALKKLHVINRADENALIYADRNMINLVIRNLLSNSIKFCNDCNEIIFSTELKNAGLTIALSDNGPGISDDEKVKLFSLEHSISAGTHGEKGNRLGLILCRDMVIQNKGTIWFDSKQNEGTTFYISLPAAK